MERCKFCNSSLYYPALYIVTCGNCCARYHGISNPFKSLPGGLSLHRDLVLDCTKLFESVVSFLFITELYYCFTDALDMRCEAPPVLLHHPIPVPCEFIKNDLGHDQLYGIRLRQHFEGG